MIDRVAKYNELIESNSHGQTIEELCDTLDEIAELKARVAELELQCDKYKHSLAGTQLASIKADVIREAINTVGYTCETSTGDDAFSRDSLEEYADNLEKGE